MRLGLVTVLIALAAAACRGPEGPAGAVGSPGPTGSPGGTPYPSIGEGIVLDLASASIAPDRTLSVEFAVTDSAGTPRVPGDDVTISWTIAALGNDTSYLTTEWTNYITKTVTGQFGTAQQPTSEKNGTYDDLGGGRYRYTFSHAIPDTYSSTALHRVGAWATATAVDGTEESNDATLDFVPNGTSATAERTVVTTEACNGCHDPLSAHGGVRKKVELCVTCHTPQNFDPDTADPTTVTLATPSMNPLNMETMVHRIHRGENLPSIQAASAAGVTGQKYSVIGYQNHESVFAATVADGPDTNTLPDVVGVAFPQPLQNCTTCHQGGAESSKWASNPVTRASCTTCHDTTWFGDPLATPPRMVNHPGSAYADDSLCGTCHVATTGNEFDISIQGAHVNPTKSSTLRGLDLKILSVSGVAGGNPALTFKVTNHDDGSVVPLSTLTSISANVNGPTTDYRVENLVNLNVKTAATLTTNGDGTMTVTFANRGATDPWYPSAAAIASDATGTFAVGMEARRTVNLAGGKTVTEGAMNPVAYFSVDGSDVTPRRQVVALDNCLSCHNDLALHGGQRKNTEYCVMCHNPTNSDWQRRPKTANNTNIAATADGIEERSIDLKRLVHRIHTGEELVATQPFYVYGYGGSLNAFGEVMFPGDRSDCETCHKPGTYTVDAVPLTASFGLANETGTVMHAGTMKHGAGEGTIGPVAAACTGCHDQPADHAHAAAQTYEGVETCLVCHGEDADFAVTKVHRKP